MTSDERASALQPDGAKGQGDGPPGPTSEVPQQPTLVKKYTKIMLYVHPKVARKIKEIAFLRERKANDVLLEAIDLYFAQTGHTGMKHVIEG